MSARKLPGSMDGSCRTSPNRTTLRRLACLINSSIRKANVDTATRLHSSTTRVFTSLCFQGTPERNKVSSTLTLSLKVPVSVTNATNVLYKAVLKVGKQNR